MKALAGLGVILGIGLFVDKMSSSAGLLGLITAGVAIWFLLLKPGREGREWEQ
jgi:hypothetical protein